MAWDLSNIFTGTSEGPANVKTYVARVLFAFPDVNLYVVRPNSNGSEAHSICLAASKGPTGTSGSKSGICETYIPGDAVVISSDQWVPGSTSATGYIIGRAADNIVYKESDHTIPVDEGVPCSVAGTDTTSGLSHPIFDKLRSYWGVLRAYITKRTGTPKDALPGDTIIQGTGTSGVYLLKHLARIQSGQRCFIETDSVFNRLRIFADMISNEGPVQSGFSGVTIKTFSEALYTALDRSEGSYDGHTPKYRHRRLAGDLVSGWMTTVGLPSADLQKIDTVFGTRIGYSGEHSVMSAHGMSFRKTYDICSPVQIEEMDGLNRYLKETSEFPLSELEMADDINDYADYLRDLSINHPDKDNQEAYFPGVSENSDTWMIDNGNTDLTSRQLNKWRQGGLTFKSVPPTQQYSPLPEHQDIEDPHTGKTSRYFNSESCIRQDPDGSIVLYDGYGSEIRMYRGNIIISPAVDLIFRPGRDIHGMAGRHIALVGQKDITVHSSLGDVYLKSNRNFSILSGLSRKGFFLVDHRGDSGVTIRSSSTSQFELTNLSINCNGSCAVIGDDVVVKGRTTSLLGSKVSIMRVSEYGGTASSGIILGRSAIISGKNIALAGNVVVGGVESGECSVTLGDTQYTLNTARNGYMIVPNYFVARSVYANSGWFESMRASRARAGNASKKSGIRGSVSSPSATINSRVDNAKVSEGQTDVEAEVIAKENLPEFTYPDSKDIGIPDNYIIPGMRWQSALVGGSYWSEPQIRGILNAGEYSMVYPGKAVWENGQISAPGNKKQYIKERYTINGRN